MAASIEQGSRLTALRRSDIAAESSLGLGLGLANPNPNPNPNPNKVLGSKQKEEAKRKESFQHLVP